MEQILHKKFEFQEEYVMLKFDEEAFLNDGKKTYKTRETIEKEVSGIVKEGIDNIVLMGVGGTIFEVASVKSIFEHYSDLDVEVIIAAEGLLQNPKNINENTLVVTGSKSGDTPETVDFAQWCKDKGAKVLSFVGSKEVPLALASTNLVVCEAPGMENTYLKYYLFATYLMKCKGFFEDYEHFADQMANLHDNLVTWKEQYEDTAKDIAKKYSQAPYQMWIGSGTLWGEVQLFAMCILEEMQWMRTRPVSANDFFHGALELVDDTFPIYLVKGEDELRPLDERVENFLNKIDMKEVVVIDTKDFKLTDIDDKYRMILSTIMLNTITRGRLAYHFEAETGHDLETRRYYRQIEY